LTARRGSAPVSARFREPNMTDVQTAEPLRFTDNPLNPLEAALYEGLADHTKMGIFEQLMLEADLYAVPEPGSPGGTPGDDGPKVLRTGEQLVLRGVVLNDGRNTVTLFTDPRRATQMFGQDARILAMKGRNLLNILKDSVVLLNPADGKGLLLNPEQIRAVLEHAPAPSARTRPSGTVELSEIPELQRPVALIDRLGGALDSLGAEAAWLARARWVEAGLSGWHLDVRTDRPADEVIALVERAVRGLAFGQEVFDVSVSRPGGEDGVGARLR
jgi:hypothetical protein